MKVLVTNEESSKFQQDGQQKI